MKPERRPTNFWFLPGRSRVVYQPLGVEFGVFADEFEDVVQILKRATRPRYLRHERTVFVAVQKAVRDFVAERPELLCPRSSARQNHDVPGCRDEPAVRRIPADIPAGRAKLAEVGWYRFCW